MKGILKGIKNELVNEVTKQLDKNLNLGGQRGQGHGLPGNYPGQGPAKSSFDLSTIQGILGSVLGTKSKHSSGGEKKKGLDKLISLINSIQQKTGGRLPGEVGRYLPGILKVAEFISHGKGDDTPRTGKHSDGSAIDNVLKTVISGRKIYGGKWNILREVGRPDPNSYPYYPQPGPGQASLPYYGGGGGVAQPSGPYQDYYALRNFCLSQGTLFEDPEFPAEDSSVYFSGGRRSFRWMRPHEIVSNPAFFHEGASRFDVKQGELGDCWLLAAVANLTMYPFLLEQVVPGDNSFERGHYAGIFHFRFWQYGKWVDVVVDDRLPTQNGRLMFMHSDSKNEFWSALLEKAYAKLHGSYEALKGGTTSEALADFTGGVTESYSISEGDTELFTLILRAYERSSLLCCSMEPDPSQTEAETREGLIKGHAYSITAVKLVPIPGYAEVPLLRIRNPWGNHKEWNGPWSDGSREWRLIDSATKHQLGLTFNPDGEFWMDFPSFCRYFDELEICNLSPDSPKTKEMKTWSMVFNEGAWMPGFSAGGCRNYLETYAQNPQYLVTLNQPESDGRCTMIVALMQKNKRALKAYGGVNCLTIGFAIYKLSGSEAPPLDRNFFKYNASIARSPTFINLREVSSRFRLPPGNYLIVPSTFEPGEEGEFILRVFTEDRAPQMSYYGHQQQYAAPIPQQQPEYYPTHSYGYNQQPSGPTPAYGWMS